MDISPFIQLIENILTLVWVTVVSTVQGIYASLVWIKNWLGPVVGAAAGKVNWTEFMRSLALGVGAAGTAAGVLQAVSSSASIWCNDPQCVSVVTTVVAIVTTLLDTLRRAAHQDPGESAITAAAGLDASRAAGAGNSIGTNQ